jgi:hypothetical protein
MTMQHDFQPSRRATMPALCGSCGAVVTGAPLTCPACGVANPTAKSNDTLDFGTEPGDPHAGEIQHTLDAKFYRTPGETGAPVIHFRPEPPEAHRPPGRHIRLADLEDEIGEDLPPLPEPHDPMDYLDAQLGLKAPGTDYVEEVRSAPLEAPRATVPVALDPVVARRSDGPGAAAMVAVGLAFFAVGTAVSVHLFAPDAIPGYSAAEVDLKVHLRAVEWLLAAVLFGLVGVLFKR